MNYLELSLEKQKSIANRYILPSDKNELCVTPEGVPYKLISGCKVICTLNTRALIGEGFHTHGVRVNS